MIIYMILTYILIIILIYIYFNKYVETMTSLEKDKKVRYNDGKLYLKYRKARISSLLDNNKKSLEKINDYPTKFKIAFLTFDNRKDDFIMMHNSNVKKYCEKWGYDFVFESENKTTISPYWYKIFLVNNLLKTDKYDYVFWMDSDTIINNFNIDLGEDILNKYDSDIFIASDNIRYDVTNAGLFIVRNSQTGKKFVEDLVSTYNESSEYCLKDDNALRGIWAMSCYEQGIINKLIMEKYDKNTTFLNGNIMENKGICSDYAFITHYYGSSSSDRALCFIKQIH